MYEAFFALRARPFSSTPSADLFFHSSAHRRTLAWLLGQVLAGEPLIVLIGDIGAGKTTVLQVLLRNLPERFTPAIVASTQLDEIELTRAVLIAFGAPTSAESLDGLRTDLRIYLEDLRSRGRPGLILVDEAQNLPASTLRYLMNLPPPDGDVEEVSAQVIISGQPGLQALLAEAAGGGGGELPICRLGPMGTTDTGGYVRHRLRVVGSADGPTFSADAIDSVQTTTGGLPRLVNRLCDRVLMSACLDQTRDIDARRVEGAAAELRDELGDPEPPALPPDNPRSVPGDPFLPPPTLSAPAPIDPPVDSGAEPDVPVPSSAEPAKPFDRRAGDRRLPYWGAAATAALVAVSLGWLGLDRPSPRNTARLDTGPARLDMAPPGTPVAPRATQPDPGLSARSATGEVRPPVTPPSQPMDARAALGLTPPSEPPPTEPFSSEPTPAPPAGAPACSDATKALGLCS